MIESAYKCYGIYIKPLSNGVYHAIPSDELTNTTLVDSRFAGRGVKCEHLRINSAGQYYCSKGEEITGAQTYACMNAGSWNDMFGGSTNNKR